MPVQREHITVQGVDTLANLNALSTYVEGHLYLATDAGGGEGRYYYGSSNNTLIGPLPGAGSTNVTSFSDTDSIDFTDNGSGDWEADLILDPSGIGSIGSSGLLIPDDFIQSLDNTTGDGVDLAENGNALSASIKAGTGISTDGSGNVIVDLSRSNPIGGSGNTISLKYTNTDSVNLGLDTGDLKADVNIASGGSESDNIAQVIPGKGLYVPSDQDDYIESVSNTSTIILDVTNGDLTAQATNLAQSEVVVDTTETTMSGWIGNNYTGSEYQEGDEVKLANADPVEAWIHNGGSAGTIADWTQMSVANLSDTYVRSLFSGEDGISYNNSNGEIAVDLATTNDAEITGSGQLKVDVSAGDVTDTNNFTTGGDTVQDFFDEITFAIQSNNSTLSQPNDQIVVGDTSNGITSHSALTYNSSTNTMGLSGDLDFGSNGDSWSIVSSNSTRYKAKVTNYGALILS